MAPEKGATYNFLRYNKIEFKMKNLQYTTGIIFIIQYLHQNVFQMHLFH